MTRTDSRSSRKPAPVRIERVLCTMQGAVNRRVEHSLAVCTLQSLSWSRALRVRTRYSATDGIDPTGGEDIWCGMHAGCSWPACCSRIRRSLAAHGDEHMLGIRQITSFLVITCMVPAWCQAEATREEKRQGDIWREAQIDTIYTLNAHLNPFTIDIDVAGNTVTLSGKVESNIERDLAEQLALDVQGVETVVNHLTIVTEVPRVADRQALFDAVNDASITAAVKSRLLWNRQTEGLDISVRTQRGRVQLSGSVDSEAEAAFAIALAENTSGVRGVTSGLRVGPGHTERAERDAARLVDEVTEKTRHITKQAQRVFSDAWIAAKVYTTLLTDRRFNAADIEVSVDERTVVLRGEIGGHAARTALIGAVHDVTGVERVDAKSLVIATR